MTMQWDGTPAPDGETADTMIKVWQMMPHPTCGAFDNLVVRDWGDFLNIAQDGIEHMLDVAEKSDLSEGVTFKIKLIEMTLGDYQNLLMPEDV